MKRLALLIVTVACGGGPLATAVAATSGSDAPAQEPRAMLRHFVCRTATEAADRRVSVTAVMRPVHGTEHLAISFELLQAVPGTAGWRALKGAGLGDWLAPPTPTLGQRPGDVWKVDHPVVDLPAPAAYRFVVRFRWSGADDQVLQTRTLRSRICRQPGQ